MKLLLVSVGGGIGAISRYLLGVAISKTHWHQTFSIPIAMLIVNLIGSFGLGLFTSVYVYGGGLTNFDKDYIYLLIAIGFFGAFTTFSTFSIEVISLIKKRKWVPMLIYIIGSVFGSIGMFAIGFFM